VAGGLASGWRSGGLGGISIFNDTAPTSFTDLDTSGTVTGPAIVRLGFIAASSSPKVFVRQDGDTDFTGVTFPNGGIDRVEPQSSITMCGVLDAVVGADGILEWKSAESVSIQALILGWAPCQLGAATQTINPTVAEQWETIDFTGDTANDGLALVKIKPTTATSFCGCEVRALGDTADYDPSNDADVGYNRCWFSNAANLPVVVEVPMIGGKIQVKFDAADETVELSLLAYIDTTQGWTTLATAQSGLSSTADTWMQDMDISNAISAAGLAVLKLENCVTEALAVRLCNATYDPYKPYNLSGIGGGCQITDPDAAGNAMFSCEVTAGGTIDFKSDYSEADFEIRCLGYVALAA